MPRLGKKTLYLDLDALDKLDAALSRFPGRPSVSSFLSEQLPLMADNIEQMADALEAGGLRGMAQMLGVATEAQKVLSELEDDIKNTLATAKNPDKKLSEVVADLPPKKLRKPRVKKVVKE